MRKKYLIALSVVLLLLSGIAYAQTQLVAFLSTDTPGVEMKREGTEQWVPINVESVVGIGDIIRTGATGSATIRFFDENSSVTLSPNTMIRIERLLEVGEGYSVAYVVLQGSTEQILASDEEKPASYEVITGGLSLVTRGGQFGVWVNEDGATDVITQAGSVYTQAGAQLLEIPASNALRATGDGELSDVIPADSIERLRASLDGVPASFAFDGDILLNVRQGPSRSATSLGTIAPDAITLVLGVSEDGRWFRIRHEDGFGWISGQSLDVEVNQTNLIAYDSSHIETLPDAAAATTIAAAAGNVPGEQPAATDTSSEVVQTAAAILERHTPEELATIARLNQWRVDQNLWPLRLNETLTKMARDQAQFLLSLPDFPADPHNDRQGRNPRQRAVAPEYQWPFYGRQDRVAVGEIAYIGINPDAAIGYWRQSQIHNQTVINAGYREIGIAALPHRLGSLYIVVLGARPDVLPALIDPAQGVVYLSAEQYRFADGGDWITQVEQVQIIPSVLSELNQTSWSSWGARLTISNVGEFAIAYRGTGDRLVISPVSPVTDVAWLPGNLPSERSVPVSAAPTATPTPILPPVTNFTPVVTNNSGSSSNAAVPARPVLFPTNTPAR
jgi:uncharacterized protein YkwD